MSSATEKLAQIRAQQHIPKPAPLKDDDSMSLASLDRWMQGLTPAEVPLHSSASFPSQPPATHATLQTQLHLLHQMIDSWGLEAWNSPDDAVIARAAFISRMIAIKGACGEAMNTLHKISHHEQQARAASLHLTTPSKSSSSSSTPTTPASVSSSVQRIRDYCQCDPTKANKCSKKYCKCVKAGSSCVAACKCGGKCVNKDVPAAPLVGIETNPGPSIDDLFRCILIPESGPIMEIWVMPDDEDLNEWPRVEKVHDLAGAYEIHNVNIEHKLSLFRRGDKATGFINQHLHQLFPHHPIRGNVLITCQDGNIPEEITPANILEYLINTQDTKEEAPFSTTIKAEHRCLVLNYSNKVVEWTFTKNPEKYFKEFVGTIPNTDELEKFSLYWKYGEHELILYMKPNWSEQDPNINDRNGLLEEHGVMFYGNAILTTTKPSGLPKNITPENWEGILSGSEWIDSEEGNWDDTESYTEEEMDRGEHKLDYKRVFDILEPILHPLEKCLHGTTKVAWELIKHSGLNRMARKFIHLAINEESKNGYRPASEVRIYINMNKAMDAGMKFYQDAKGVILTEGINGIIPPEYFKDVTFMQYVNAPQEEPPSTPTPPPSPPDDSASSPAASASSIPTGFLEYM